MNQRGAVNSAVGLETAQALPGTNAGALGADGASRMMPDPAAGLPELLLLFCLVFVLQSGLVPFQFQSSPGKPYEAFFEVSDPSLPDRISNIALYVPLAFFAHWVIVRRIGRLRHNGLATGITVLAIVGLSAIIEAMQHFSPVRVSSIMDVICNTTGAAVGVALSSTTQALGVRWWDQAVESLRRNPAAAAIKAYVVVLFVTAALPFTFTLEPARLKDQFKTAVFRPFGTPPVAGTAPTAGDRTVAGAYSQLHAWKRWSRFAAEAASFIVLGWMLVGFLRPNYGFSVSAAAALTSWLAGLLAIALSLLQLTIISRGFDITDILFRCLGAILGSVTASLARSGRERPFALAGPLSLLPPHSSTLVRPSRYRSVLIFAGCAASAAFILYNGLIPPRYEFTFGRAAPAVSFESFLPFVAYFTGRFDRMTADVAEKLAGFAVLAGLLAAWHARSKQAGDTAGWVRITASCAALSATIEIVQMFSLVRVASLTDPLLAVGGAILGLFIYRFATQFRATADQALAALSLPQTAERPLSPTDELIATLTEPYPNAPAEPRPLNPTRRLRSFGVEPLRVQPQSELPP